MPISIWLDFSFWIFAKVSICQIFYQSKKWWFVKNPPVSNGLNSACPHTHSRSIGIVMRD
jgi:hypothetical protein